MNNFVFGLTDFADILYTWCHSLIDMWVWATTTSAFDMLQLITTIMAGTVVGLPAGIVLEVYIIICNAFDPNYLVTTSVLEFMLGGMLTLFVTITIFNWLSKFVSSVLPDIVT